MTISLLDLSKGMLSTVEREIDALGGSILINEIPTGEFQTLQKIDDADDRIIAFLRAGISDASGKKMTELQAKSLKEKNSLKVVKQIIDAIINVSTGDNAGNDSPTNSDSNTG